MRIALIIQEDPFYLPQALDKLCAARQRDIVALIILPHSDECLDPTAKSLYQFYGLWDTTRLLSWFVWAKTAECLNRLVPLTCPHSAVDVARRYQIPIYWTADINSVEFVATLRSEIHPDLLIFVELNEILSECVLEVPTLGAINLHSALLPYYEGMMPNFWTRHYAGPEAAAVIVRYMVEEPDAGDVILQLPVPIYPDDSLHELMVRFKQVGVQALLEVVKEIDLGNCEPDTSGSSNKYSHSPSELTSNIRT